MQIIQRQVALLHSYTSGIRRRTLKCAYIGFWERCPAKFARCLMNYVNSESTRSSAKPMYVSMSRA
ncbi:unnamed protein product, partial [Nesidiocoris tenuis]